MTLAVVVLDKLLDPVPVVPVTGTLNGATPVAQVTDRVALANEVLQPEGGTKPELTANATLPVNPLIGVKLQGELPVTVARVVIPEHDMLKSTTWKVAGGSVV